MAISDHDDERSFRLHLFFCERARVRFSFHKIDVVHAVDRRCVNEIRAFSRSRAHFNGYMHFMSCLPPYTDFMKKNK